MRTDILFITDRRFWRRSIGSEQRIASLVEYAAARGDSVHVAYVGRVDAEEKSRIAAFTRAFPGLEIETRSIKHALRTAVPGLRPRRARSDSEFSPFGSSSPARRSFVESVLRTRRPRVVIVEFLRLIQTVYPRPDGLDEDTRFVIDTHDLLYQRAERYRAAGASVAREIGAGEEMRALKTFDAIIAIQDKEGSLIRRTLPESEVLVIPHGLDLPNLPGLPSDTLRSAESQCIRLGFLGGRDEANRGALDWFMEQVWPALESRFGQKVELCVAGQVCHDWHHEAPGVNRVGLLDRIEDFWPTIDIAINPVRFGSGLKIKNVEALAFALPLLTTAVGAEGLEEAGESGIAIEEDAEGWIRRLSEWIEAPSGLAARGRAGRAFAEAELSQEAAFRSLGTFLDRHASRPGPRPTNVRDKILVLSSQRAFEALAGRVPEEMSERFVFLKPHQEKMIERVLPLCRLVISKNYPRPDVNRWIFIARRRGVPTLLLVDGPLEWANVHANPSLQQPGAEAARSLFAPVIHDAVASIGAAQTRWIEAQNTNRELVLLEYANRRIVTMPLPERAFEFDFLLTTAKAAAFSKAERARLGAALEGCAHGLQPYGARILVRLFDSSLSERVRTVLPNARFETQGSFTDALARAACVIGTPSSVLLEAMLHNKPTATLLFRSHPLFYETGWQIEPNAPFAKGFTEMLQRNEARLHVQAESLQQNLSHKDFYRDGLLGSAIENLTAPRPLDEADLEFEHRVLTWEERHEARLATRVRRFTLGLH